MELEEYISGISASDTGAWEKARKHWNSLAKPLGSLGVLEENIIRIAALTGNPDVRLNRRRLLVFCADNGVTQQGVSQSDHSVTTAVASALGRGDSTASFMARAAGCEILPVDIGMKDETPAGVLRRKIRRSTNDISEEPAMTREECIRAIMTGISLVKEEEADILLVGEMGIGNTTTGAAVSCVLLGKDAAELAGKGAGLSGAGLKKKIEAIRRAIDMNRPDAADPVDVISKVGGLDIAALCGVCLGGAYYHVPVLLDGMITNAAALCAARMNQNACAALIASHISEEPAAKLLLEELELSPCISAGLHLGEGSGALLLLPLLCQALAVYHSGHTFDHLGIEAYKPLM